MDTTELDATIRTYEADVRDESFAERTVRFVDPLITGRDMIESLGYHPADDYVVLRYRPDGALEEIGLETHTALTEPRENSFFVNHGSEMANIVIDGVRLTWTQRKTMGETLKRLSRQTPEDIDLFQERGEEAPLLVADDDVVDLHHPGVERFFTKPVATERIQVNEKKVPIRRGWETGAQIKAAAIAAGVPIEPSFTLSEDESGGKIIGDNDRIFIRGGELFLAVDDHDDS